MKTWQWAWAVLGLSLLIPAAQGQSNVRVRGTIAAVTGDSLAVAEVGAVQATGKRELTLQYKDGVRPPQ